LPATMKLLGERNWYLPRWLEWLPRVDHGAAPLGVAGERVRTHPRYARLTANAPEEGNGDRPTRRAAEEGARA
ncbi:MAG TPA: hypothetical protein VN522_03595, partial [Solirubrobacterales bacterium]|nr:hypothetical protein [Solirubrobacterales bacterium]